MFKHILIAHDLRDTADMALCRATQLAQQKAALQAMHCPEADWFIEHCLPCYTQNLDELTRQQ